MVRGLIPQNAPGAILALNATPLFRCASGPPVNLATGGFEILGGLNAGPKNATVTPLNATT